MSLGNHNSKSTEKVSQCESDKEPIIREVYIDNFIEEIKNLSRHIESYNYVAMDTEFPGIVYQSSVNTREAYYRTIKTNVDKLKLIQVGISIKNEEGNSPQGCSTWQFNLKFDLNNDQYSNESIALLTNSGINFELLENRGIPADMFGEYLISSGLVLNEDIHWISFHGIYDFAYFLRCVTNLPLPDNEIQFFETLKIYFPNYFDIRFLVRYNDELRGSLSRLGQELNISRVGTKHQAGSDSLITCEIFFKLKKDYFSEDTTKNDKNILFGIGAGLEDNDVFSSFNPYFGLPSVNNVNYKFNSNGSNSNAPSSTGNNFNYEYNNFYNQNLLNMQYNGYIRPNSGYFPSVNMNVYPPFNNYNSMNMNYPGNTSSSISANSSNNLTPNIFIGEDRKKFGPIAGKIIED